MRKIPLWQDVFFQYPVNELEVSTGNVALPIFYYDSSVCMAIFMVDLENARSLVMDERLEVVRFRGDQAMVAIAFYEYRLTAIGSYNEVGVAIAVEPKGVVSPRMPLLTMLGPLDKNPMGFHVIDLPVTTDSACAAGREVWGLPKFVTPIEFNLRGNRFLGQVKSPDEECSIISLEGAGTFGLPAPLLDLSLYSVRDGKLLRALVNTRGGCKCMLGGSIRARVDRQSSHPMANRLRQLGLDNAKPRFVMASHRLQLRLNAGAQVPSIETPLPPGELR